MRGASLAAPPFCRYSDRTIYSISRIPALSRGVKSEPYCLGVGEGTAEQCSGRVEASVEQIISYCNERLAAHNYPWIVELFDELLLKGRPGKILRRELRAS
jgi:acyl-CoA synthetase (AMP-forming)/AMP-acid ligase II